MEANIKRCEILEGLVPESQRSETEISFPAIRLHRKRSLEQKSLYAVMDARYICSHIKIFVFYLLLLQNFNLHLSAGDMAPHRDFAYENLLEDRTLNRSYPSGLACG